MAVQHLDLAVSTDGPGFYDLTDQIQAVLQRTKLKTGIVSVFCRTPAAA